MLVMSSALPFSPQVSTLLKQYLELDTSRSDGKNYPTAIKMLADFTTSIGFEATIVPIPDSVAGGPNRQHLIAHRFQAENLPTLLIYNHIDVVPATYSQAFELQVRDGKIFARGACDQKGSTITILSALEKLQTKSLRFNLIFIATTDEETNQLAQLHYLTEKLQLPTNTLVFDPDTLAGGVSVATLGLMQLEITVEGKSVHSGVSHFGINAIEQAATIIEYLKTTEKTRLEAQTSQFASFPSTGVKHICSRANVNMISGGTAPNVVPDRCLITVDFRFIPESDVQVEAKGIMERLQAFAIEHQISIALEQKVSCESYATTHPEADRLNEIYEKRTGEGGLYGVLGSTHAAEWCKKLGLPHFGIGVARGDTNMHGNDEFAYITDMVSLEQTFIEYLQLE